ncbi:PIN domain-containing protein [Singulisphaera sp. PoT]|uniref:PIN domain-containing protein n=1 Tax=Singulisphaera sp. PoT TaxID=3411797 RepID=UPI003BF53872
MGVIIYVETNFLMSVAMGREEKGYELLDAVSESVRVAIPSGCFMESFSAFEDEKKRRGWFRDQLDKQINQLKRDATSKNARELLANFTESRLANDRLLNDIQDRLFRFVDRASGVLDRIAESDKVLGQSISEILIP